MRVVAGIDIGGTKCSVSFAEYHAEEINILTKKKIETPTDSFEEAAAALIAIIRKTLRRNNQWQLCSIGISCGGPLDSKSGWILSPPNLKAWGNVEIFSPFKKAFNVPIMLQNDADACALAEWKHGAGKGTRNMIYLTFGTGMGAGLILNSKLYIGSSNMAGEVGHIRLAENGPFGYGKYGSFEGFCSGGGIADLGRSRAKAAIEDGRPPLFCPTLADLPGITARNIAQAVGAGDEVARDIYLTSAAYLGRGIAVLIDILNPELVVIGSIYERQEELMKGPLWEMISREALPESARECRVVPAQLGDFIGDYAALSVGMNAYMDLYNLPDNEEKWEESL